MTTNPEIMNLWKILLQNKKFRTPMDLTTPTRNSGNIDLLMNPQMTIPIVPPINQTQRSIQQSTFSVKFVFTGVSITNKKRNRNMSLKHRDKTKTSNQRNAIPIENSISENAVDKCSHDATEHTHDVMNDDINFNFTKINTHLTNAKKTMNKAYQDIKNPIILKIAKQIEKLITNPYIDKNTLIPMPNFNVINSKLDKIIKKIENPEFQLIEIPNGHHHTQNQKNKYHMDTKSGVCHKRKSNSNWPGLSNGWLFQKQENHSSDTMERKKTNSNSHKPQWNIKPSVSSHWVPHFMIQITVLRLVEWWIHIFSWYSMSVISVRRRDDVIATLNEIKLNLPSLKRVARSKTTIKWSKKFNYENHLTFMSHKNKSKLIYTKYKIYMKNMFKMMWKIKYFWICIFLKSRIICMQNVAMKTLKNQIWIMIFL